MDYWSSPTGILAKKLYYKNKIIGAPLALWGLILENFLPGVQKLYSSPHREVIGDAHFSLGYMNLYELSGNESYLNESERFLEEMLKYSSPGYSGLCWGYNFGWQTPHGYWKPGIPLMAITPYAFWAFKKHYEITNVGESKRIAISIADFALNDIKAIDMPNGTESSGYSPVGDSIVINTNTYRAAVLMDAYSLTNDVRYKKAADENITFTLSYQGSEGEWYYEAKEDKKDNFIDNFHTCFVLRNLYRCYLVNSDENLLSAIKRGYDYYLANLFYENGRPKHFAKAKYAKLRKYEMYDYAEGISLGLLLKNDIPGAFEKAEWRSGAKLFWLTL